jgi:hypothetical protein
MVKSLRIHSEALSHQSFPVFRAVDKRAKNRLERLLSVFADVRAGEGVTALLMTANIFLLLGEYALGKLVLAAAAKSGGDPKTQPVLPS